jgi:hypothetical protein
VIRERRSILPQLGQTGRTTGSPATCINFRIANMKTLPRGQLSEGVARPPLMRLEPEELLTLPLISGLEHIQDLLSALYR